MLATLLSLPLRVVAQELDFRAPPSAADASAPAVMRDLAVRMLPVYQDSNQERFLANLSAIQMVAGDRKTAYATRQALIERRRSADAGRPTGRAAVFDIYIKARAIEAEARVPFAQAFTLAFRGTVPRLDDREAYLLIGWLSNPASELRDSLQRAFDQRRNKTRITMAEAVELVWAYFSFDAYRSFASLMNALDSEESRRRYVTEVVKIKTTDGAIVTAVIVRPKLLKKMPALLEFSIEEAQNDGKESASHGYVGVMAYTRGTHGGTGEVVPFLHDGEDAHAAIVWITKQSWSNGVVGMYGGGYSGFAAYAAAKRPLPALKAIAISDPIVPGVDFPMVNNIFQNSAYRWAFRVTNTTGASEKVFDDDAQWRAFNQSWYGSGKSYREFASVPGPHTVLFDSWLSHPSNDRYWQKMLPDREQLARINIPVLTTTGYFSEGEVGALHYFSQHYQLDPKANHTLLIGPYDERAMQHGSFAALKGYQIDSAALIDLRELRYQWFDHVLKGGQKPAVLKDRVNYQVMGTNEWRSAPSLQDARKRVLKFFLEPDPAGDRNRLATAKSAKAAFLPQTFDLADRDDANTATSANIASRNLAIRNGEMYISEPLQQRTLLNGAFSGLLDFTANKMDLDVSIALYELLANGEYLALFDPPYDFRASYARDRAHRRLLKAGIRQQLPFRSEKLTSRMLQAGSRIVMVLGISKWPDRQVNYGTGNDVSGESIADARVPLRIRWYNGSYIDLPIEP
jgi:putative CocE/NonD family hydrolase